MQQTINIVEPTLMNEAGHCYSFINALFKARNKDTVLNLWVDRQATLRFAEENIQMKKYFIRRYRRFQSYFLYKKLLITQEKVFISTAGLTDLLLMDWASKFEVVPGKIYFYCHWFKVTERKLANLRRIASRQANFVILGPTDTVTNIFKEAGFKCVHVVPYPIYKIESPQTETDKFRYLLYAGAARRDKGFTHVVNLIAYMYKQGLDIPIVLQTSPEHYGKYEATIQEDLQRLQNIPYTHLRICPETFSVSEYSALFHGAICLQFYDENDFKDRISGVTLDAFLAGCPIVATEGTWMAKMVQRFQSGLTIKEKSPNDIMPAIQRVIENYSNYTENAKKAGKILREENDASTLFRILAK